MAGDTLPPVIGELQLTIDDLVAKLDEARQKLQDFASEHADATVGADTSDADARLDDVREKIDTLDEAHAEPTVSADTAEADEGIDDTRAKLDEIDGTDANATVTADTAEANTKIDETKAKLDELKAQNATAHVTADTGSADSAVGSFIAKLMTLGPVAGASAVAVGGAFMALPGIMAGVSAGLGSLLIGFHNIAGAIEAYTNASQQAGMTGLQMAQEQVSNAQTLTNAANQVAAAQMTMAQTEVTVYDQVHQAQEAVIQSEQQLEQAEYGERMAQMQLTDARMQATFALQNYQNQLKDMALSVSQAQLAIQNARLSLNETMADPLATQLQRQQAKLSYEQALQQLTDLQTQQKQLQAEAALAAKRGVTGSEQVRQATQGVTAAQQQLQDAQRARSDAFMYLSQAEVMRTQDLTQAQRQLTLAIQNQAYAEREVALAMAMPIGAMQQLDAAMAKLTPAGVQFVNWWHANMSPLLHSLTVSDQATLLPGLEKVLQVLRPYISALRPILDHAAHGFVQFAMAVAHFLSSAQGLHELRSTMASGLVFMSDLGKVIVDVMRAFGHLGVAAGPIIRELGSGMAHMAADFARFAGGSAVKDFVKLFEELAPVLGRVLHNLGPLLDMAVLAAVKWKPLVGVVVALLPVFEALAPSIVKLLVPLSHLVHVLMTHLDTTLIEVFRELLHAIGPLMPPLLSLISALGNGLIQSIGTLMTAMLPLVNLLVSALVPAFDVLTPIVRTLGPLVLPIVTGFLALFGALNPVVDVIVFLGIVVGELANHWRSVWDTIREIGVAAWHVLEDTVFLPLRVAIHLVEHVITWLAGAWSGAWNTVSQSALAAWQFLTNDVFRPLQYFLSGVIGGTLHAFEVVWDGVWSAVRSAAVAAWQFIDNNVIHPIASFFSGVWHHILAGAKDAWQVLWDGIKTIVQIAWDVVGPIIHAIVGGIHLIMTVWHGLTDLWHSGGSSMTPASFAGRYAGPAQSAAQRQHMHHYGEGGLAVNPQVAWLAESGPELVLNPAQTQAVMHSESRPGLPGFGMGGETINIYVPITKDPTPAEVARLIGLEMRARPK